jgi:hypothetical protein
MMKVYLGPYVSWLGPYQLTDKLFFWTEKYPEDKTLEERWDYKAKDKFGDWLADTWVTKFLNWVYSKRNRKEKVHIDYYDVWSMDHTLSLIIHPMLLKLKEVKHGSPWVDDEDVPEHLRSTSAPPLTEEEKNWGTSDAFLHDRWSWVLDEMIFAHHSIINDWQDEYYDRKDYDGMKVVEERIANGLKLFGKYYQGLWD